MGYPDGLQGQNIPILARILAVVDVYEALTAERSYKKAMPHENAYNIITQGAGVQFDPQVVAAFQRVHNDIYEASKVLKQQLTVTMQPNPGMPMNIPGSR